jgi:long-chain-fatty-acid--CoA ligase ACSBG
MNADDLDFRVADATKQIKIRYNFDDEIASKPSITVPALLQKTAEQFPNHEALKQKNPVTNEWEVLTYSEYKHKVEKMAKVFIKLGLERYHAVAILAFNSAEWFISELAAIQAG